MLWSETWVLATHQQVFKERWHPRRDTTLYLRLFTRACIGLSSSSNGQSVTAAAAAAADVAAALVAWRKVAMHVRSDDVEGNDGAGS